MNIFIYDDKDQDECEQREEDDQTKMTKTGPKTKVKTTAVTKM